MNRYSLHMPRPSIPVAAMGLQPGDRVMLKIPVRASYPTPTPATVLRKIFRKDGITFLTVQWANGLRSGWKEEWFTRYE